MTNEMRVEWVGRADMAEVAEAIGVPTDLIMAVHSTGAVIWSDGVDDDSNMWWAVIGRDADGLIVVGPRRITGSVGELNRRLADAMRDRFGDPPNGVDPRPPTGV